MNKLYPKIIGISGVTGAGKTTLANALAENLQSIMLSWDDFDDVSISPADYVEWYHRGGNYTEWNYQVLADVLHILKTNKSILHPISNQVLQPTEYIIFDAPLGRLHTQTGIYIDSCIHISLPLDISLSRRLIRDFKGNEKSKDELLSELDGYLHHSRPLFFDDDLKASADFVVDGMLNTEKQILKINEYLQREKS